MIKTYKLNMHMNSARIILEGNSGNKVVYDFGNGNVMNNTPARLTLTGKYEQDLLESNNAFKNHTILLEKAVETEAEKAARLKAEQESQKNEEVQAEQPVEAVNDTITVEPDIKTVTEACNYVASHWGLKVTKAAQAKAIALQNGVDFVNLRIGKRA